MAEIIQLWEFQQARRRAERRSGESQNLERALALMRDNLAGAAEDLREAPVSEQAELLNRMDRKEAARILVGIALFITTLGAIGHSESIIAYISPAK